MKSLLHVYCDACYPHKYFNIGQRVIFPINTWYYGWARELEHYLNSVPLDAHGKGCRGCARLNIRHAQVLAIFLWKVGVEVKK